VDTFASEFNSEQWIYRIAVIMVGSALLHAVRFADLTQQSAAPFRLSGLRGVGASAGEFTFLRNYSRWAHDKGVHGKVAAE
jgi:hypothetical protein